MAILVITNQHVGPLPINVSFASPTDAPATIVVSGSVWTQGANSTIGIQVSLDGKPIGSAAIWSNAPATHRAVVPTCIPVNLSIGSHVLTLSPLNAATVSDLNDRFSAALHY